MIYGGVDEKRAVQWRCNHNYDRQFRSSIPFNLVAAQLALRSSRVVTDPPKTEVIVWATVLFSQTGVHEQTQMPAGGKWSVYFGIA